VTSSEKLKSLNTRLNKAINQPHQNALLDSILFLNGSRTKQAGEFARFVSDLFYNEPIDMQPLKGFSSEVRGWCISWVGAYLRGDINVHAERIREATAYWFNVEGWDNQ
jgi:hypothetical protein